METASSLSNFFVGSAGQQGPTLSGATLDTTTAGAPTTGLFGNGGNISPKVMQLISDGSTFASAASSIMGGYQQEKATKLETAQKVRSLNLQSQEQELLAAQEEVRGKQEANDITDRMIQTIAAQRLAFASQGIDIGFGTPVSITESSRNLANRQLSVTRDDALTRMLTARRQAYALKSEAGNVLASGKLTAGGYRTAGYIKASSVLSENILRGSERG